MSTFYLFKSVLEPEWPTPTGKLVKPFRGKRDVATSSTAENCCSLKKSFWL